MLGSIIGDIVGSIYEFGNIKTKDFEFLGDTLMIYREKFEHPTKYKIIEKKAELEEMLREHYISK